MFPSFLSILLTLCGLWLALPARAAEVDQFTRLPGEPTVLSDSAPLLEAEVNRRIQRAMVRANQRVMQVNHKQGSRWVQPGCDEARLYDALVAFLARSVIGQVESVAENAVQVTRRRVPFEQSIYREFDWPASPTLVLTGRMAAVINLAGVEMGTDKLGHFFTEGYSYFLVTEGLQRPLESALLFGEWSEAVYFGAQTTGVFSFADLAANVQGLRFWNRVRAQQPDPLTAGRVSAYVDCRGDRWVQAQAFRWADYVDAGWSEAVNCPLLRNALLLQKVQHQTLHCEVASLPWTGYGAWSSRLLNGGGFGVLPEALQPEQILRRRMAQADVAVSAATLQYLGELRLRLEAWRAPVPAVANRAAQEEE